MFTNFEIMQIQRSVTINFFNQTKPFNLRGKQKLRAFIRELLNKEKKELESLSIIFCSDRQLLDINRQYLKHDYYTDIITFELPGEKPGSTTGEIYISVERVKDNAIGIGASQNKELHRVIFHGILHLCGQKDKKPADIKRMRDKEEECLSRYNL